MVFYQWYLPMVSKPPFLPTIVTNTYHGFVSVLSIYTKTKYHDVQNHKANTKTEPPSFQTKTQYSPKLRLCPVHSMQLAMYGETTQTSTSADLGSAVDRDLEALRTACKTVIINQYLDLKQRAVRKKVSKIRYPPQGTRCDAAPRPRKKTREQEAKSVCGPEAQAAARANDEAVRILDGAAHTIRDASGKLGWFSAIAKTTQPKPKNPESPWHDYFRTMGLAPVVARAALTAAACARVVVDSTQDTLDDAIRSHLLSQPRSIKTILRKTWDSTTIVVEKQQKITPERLQPILDDIGFAQAALIRLQRLDERYRNKTYMMSRTAARHMDHRLSSYILVLDALEALEKQLHRAQVNANDLRRIIWSKQWWHGPGSARASAMVVARVVEEVQRGSACVWHLFHVILRAEINLGHALIDFPLCVEIMQSPDRKELLRLEVPLLASIIAVLDAEEAHGKVQRKVQGMMAVTDDEDAEM